MLIVGHAIVGVPGRFGCELVPQQGSLIGPRIYIPWTTHGQVHGYPWYISCSTMELTTDTLVYVT